MMIAIETQHFVTVRRTEVFEATMFKRMRDHVAAVIWLVVTVPMVVVNVRN